MQSVTPAKRFLVTGSAGFIGSSVTDALLAAGHEVMGIDNFDPFYPVSMKRSNTAGHLKSGRFRLAEVDIRDFDRLKAAVEGKSFDAIIHLAAKGGVRPSIEDPITYQEVNVGGTHNLLELARSLGVKQFVFAGSSSVYGLNPNLPWREDDAVLQPISPYASTKVSGELLGHVYAHLFGIRFIGLRFFNVYGPRQRPDLVIQKFHRLILERRPIPVYGDGSTRRDYTYIDDIVSGVISASGYSGSGYEIINLGNNRTVSLMELIGTLEQVLGTEAIIDRLPEQAGDVPRTWADIGKAGELLGYRPSTDLRTGLGRFAAWAAGNG
ncbi:MAG: GDP-mannose 4,6-dehydratase [Opitutaceae bacterium]